MKCLYRFILPVLVLFCVEAKSQAYVYHPFPDSNIVWQGYNRCGIHSTGWSQYWTFNITRDTTINSLLYHIIGSSNWDLGCIREDSSQRVYFFNLSNLVNDTFSQERLLYDFSFSVGSEIISSGTKLTVFQVDTPVYYGIPRRTLHLTDSVYWGFDTDRWIEGIGSFWGPLAIWRTYLNYCHDSHLCFAQQGSATIFQKDSDVFSYACANFISIGDAIANENINISPNPTTTSFTLQLSSPPTTQTYFQLYNAIGQPVKREEVISETTTLQRGNLPTGIYFWQLQTGNKILQRGKLVME